MPSVVPRDDKTADQIRVRVEKQYGEAIAAALSRRGDGWTLDTRAGRVTFRPTRTRFRRAKPDELREGLASPGASTAGASLLVHAASAAEEKLVRGRIGAGVLPRPPNHSPLNSSAVRKPPRSTAKRKREKAPPLPNPLDRLLALLREAGLRPTVESGKPTIDGLNAHFRRVPGYGICLDDGGTDVHLLPLDTLIFRPSASERRSLDRATRRGPAFVVRAGSQEERSVLLARFRELANRPLPSPGTSSRPALESPLGHSLLAHLPHWTQPPFNLLLLEHGAISIRKGPSRIGMLRRDRLTVGALSLAGDFLTAGAPWKEADEHLQEAMVKWAQDTTATREQTSSDVGDGESVLNRTSGWRPKSAPLPPPQPRATERVPRVGRRVSDRAGRHGDQRHRLDAAPPGLPGELVELVLAASKDIRLARNAAFSQSIELRSGDFSIRFAPLEGEAPRVRAPFEVQWHAGRRASGFIWLWTGDPLSLVFLQPPSEPDEGLVWAATLLAFADLTVWPEPEPAQQRRPTARRTQGRWWTPTPRKQQLPKRRTLPNHRRRRESGLNIETLRAHMVAGHKRWLPDGFDASAEKIQEAARLGIRLEAGQTWVTAHSRGTVTGAQRMVTVDWEPPPLLAGLL
jgi:hypothetical protein